MKSRSVYTLLRGLLWMAMAIGGYSCANIVPPAGGDKDLTPPKLLSMTPQDSLRNQRVKKIVLHFNKFVEVNDLQKYMDVSPLLDIPPTVIANGKRIEIKIVDSLLQPNTTYRIALGNAITDNREKTPYPDFRYTFTTGSYFDSLQIKGRVIDVLEGRPDTGAIVVLYPEPFTDSMILTRKPMYVGRVRADGTFRLSGLPDKSFRLLAIADADNNRMYGQEERMAFVEAPIQPRPETDSIQAFTLYSFKAAAPKAIDTSAVDTVPSGLWYIGKVISTDKNARVYTIQADSSHLDQPSFELNQPLGILLNTTVGAIDSSKIYLSYLNKGDIETEAQRSLRTDSSHIWVHHDWEPETLYTLRLVKGWAKDTSGAELPPAKFSFRTKRREDYAIMRIHIPAEYRTTHFVLSVYQEQDSVYQQPVSDSVVSLSMLHPGKYTIRIIEDRNQNGIWDAGDFWKKRQPEMVYPHKAPIDLKAGWEHEVDFTYDPAVMQDPRSALKARM